MSTVSSQDQLAANAQKTAKDMERVTEVTKQAAGALGDDSDSQVRRRRVGKEGGEVEGEKERGREKGDGARRGNGGSREMQDGLSGIRIVVL